MKSLNFNKSNAQQEDVLSKTQMKNIMGGHGGGGGNFSTCSATCLKGSPGAYVIEYNDCNLDCKANDNEGISCKEPLKSLSC